ncbi:hypothetical protein HMN09_01006700 [Mycena chlorophos]|uniref:Uncharacterized protein n=1 Tax=Mycena chlorophos TaxID=658473 RepID=A0A8H6SEE1_MYCCL|nr:hypothetical protein HMN09_01006700 [Mycena chlorophos]
MSRYYQLGGFEGHVHPADYKKKLPDVVYDALSDRETGDLELLLGIKTSGTSHLLVSEDTLQNLFRNTRHARRNQRPSFRAGDFESLSPLVFKTRSSFAKKLDDLTPKAGTGRGAKDLSRANKQYQDSNPSAPLKKGVARGQFENARVFYRLYAQPELARNFDIDLMGIPRTTDRHLDIPILCFAYNTWTKDSRSREDRTRAPKVLDLAWGEAPDLGNEDADAMKTATHLFVEANISFKNPNQKPFEAADINGPTETLAAELIESRSRDFFAQYSRKDKPVIMLVHDKVVARNVLHAFKLETHEWDFGDDSLRRLLRLHQFSAPPHPAPRDPRRRVDDRDPARDHARRSRSRSPRHHSSSSSHRHDRSPLPRRERSPLPRIFAPIYIVDIKSLYSTLFRTETYADTVPNIIKHTKIYPEEDCNGWCAGNELMMLWMAFRAMARRGGVDEQLVDEWPGVGASGVGQVPAASAGSSSTSMQTAYNDDVSDYGSEEETDEEG